MTGYTRQSSFSDDDIVEAFHHNDEFNRLVEVMDHEDGHKHDGTAGEGPVIKLIGDPGIAVPLNKVLIDTAGDTIKFNINVSAASVEQMYLEDGALLPSVDGDINLGSASLKFGDLFLSGSLSSTGSALTDPEVSGLKILDTSEDHTYTIGVSELAADRTVTLPLLTTNDTFAMVSMAQTLTNKTLTSPTINGGTITGITDLAVADGGTGSSTASGARNNLGLGNVDNTSDANKPISSATQSALDAKEDADPTLTALAALSLVANDLVYATGVDTFSVTTLTSFARSLLDDATATEFKTTLGLENVDNTADTDKPVSTATQTALDNKQPLDATLTSLAALATTEDRFIYSTGVDTFGETPVSVVARSVLSQTTDEAMRAALGLEIGVDVQAHIGQSQTITTTVPTDVGATDSGHVWYIY